MFSGFVSHQDILGIGCSAKKLWRVLREVAKAESSSRRRWSLGGRLYLVGFRPSSAKTNGVGQQLF